MPNKVKQMESTCLTNEMKIIRFHIFLGKVDSILYLCVTSVTYLI